MSAISERHFRDPSPSRTQRLLGVAVWMAGGWEVYSILRTAEGALVTLQHLRTGKCFLK